MLRVMRVRVLVPLLLLSFVPLFASSAVAQSGYGFEDSRGRIVLSDVGYDDWYDGSVFTVELSINPAQYEIGALLQSGSHVDFTIYIDGFSVDSKKMTVGQSGYLTRLESGDKLIRRASSATVSLVGYKLEKWVHGRTLTISVGLTGEIANGANYPEVEVVMTSSTYWPEDSDCRAVDDLVDKHGNDLCAEHGPEMELVTVLSTEEIDDDVDTIIVPDDSDDPAGCGQFWPSTGEFELSESDGIAFSAILRFSLTQDEIDALGCSGSTFGLNFRVEGLWPIDDPRSFVSSDLPGYTWEMSDDGWAGSGSVTSAYGIPVYDLEAGVDYFVTVDFLDLEAGDDTPTISFEWVAESGDMVSLSDNYYGGPLPLDGWYVAPFGG